MCLLVSVLFVCLFVLSACFAWTCVGVSTLLTGIFQLIADINIVSREIGSNHGIRPTDFDPHESKLPRIATQTDCKDIIILSGISN